MVQDAYVSTLRLIVTPELTAAPAENEAAKEVADRCVSPRVALACTTLPQARIQGYIVAPLRVQAPTNLDVRRLSAILRSSRRTKRKLCSLR